MQINNDYLSGLQWPGEQSPADKAAKNNKVQLEQEDFFALLTQQLAYQDPFKPADNAQMISQMSSFATAEGISNMSSQLAGLNEVMTSNQALQASSLVGQKVLVPSNIGNLSGGEPVDGIVVAGEGADNIKIRIEDKSGQLVREIALDGYQSGNVPFQWDGLNNQGEPAADGNYTFKVSALVGSQREDLNALMFARVDSVTLGGGGTPTLVNLSGLGGLPLSQVLEIAGRKAA
ncbi:flagellar hook assembly protein FlgD [Zobellella sp. DQSA1]|uniref:flagellar hook assembly protein FlgD n=1 Tax=Zobellella sp. DQSA1 TaxID=3342386 RepID=UPI0035C13E6B